MPRTLDHRQPRPGDQIPHPFMARQWTERIFGPTEDQRGHPHGAERLLLIWPVAQRPGLAQKHFRPEAERHIEAEIQDCPLMRAIGQVIGLHLVAHDLA